MIISYQSKDLRLVTSRQPNNAGCFRKLAVTKPDSSARIAAAGGVVSEYGQLFGKPSDLNFFNFVLKQTQMEFTSFISDFENLPKHIQRQLIEYAEFLKSKYMT